MKITRHIALSFLLLGLTCLTAIAQEPSGKFTVTHDTRWGTAVLPAGSYYVSLHTGPVPYVLVTSESHNAVSIMAVAQYLDHAECKSSSLELEQSSGSWNVRSLCFESTLAAHFLPAQKGNAKVAAAPPQVAAISGSN